MEKEDEDNVLEIKFALIHSLTTVICPENDDERKSQIEEFIMDLDYSSAVTIATGLM